MSNSESFFVFGRKTLFMLGAILCLAASGLVAESVNAQQNRVARITSTFVMQSAQPQQAVVFVQLDATGNETSFSFSFNFNPAVLTNPVVTIGNGVPASSNIGTNMNNVAQGQVGVLVDTVNTYVAGTRNVAMITFTVVGGTPLGLYPVNFGDVPTQRSLATSPQGALVTPTYVNGAVQVGSTAAGVEITGRVLTPDGRGIRNSTVILTDSTGARRTATTSSFGYYKFEDVESGTTYVVSVASKQYRFTPRVLQVVDSLTDFDFVGQQ